MIGKIIVTETKIPEIFQNPPFEIYFRNFEMMKIQTDFFFRISLDPGIFQVNGKK